MTVVFPVTGHSVSGGVDKMKQSCVLFITSCDSLCVVDGVSLVILCHCMFGLTCHFVLID